MQVPCALSAVGNENFKRGRCGFSAARRVRALKHPLGLWPEVVATSRVIAFEAMGLKPVLGANFAALWAICSSSVQME